MLGMDATENTQTDGWTALGREVVKRRKKLRLTQEELVGLGGPSAQTIRAIETGVEGSYRPSTFSKLDHALNWADGVAERVLSGTATEEDLTTNVVRGTARSVLGDLGGGSIDVDKDGRILWADQNGRVLRALTKAEAGTASGTGAAHDPTVVTEDGPTVVLVTTLLARLAQEEGRSEAADGAFDALLRLLPELKSGGKQ